MTEVLEARQQYLELFERMADGRPLRDLRRRAIDHFAATGFPTGREEEWRYTDVAPIAETAFRMPEGPAAPGALAALAAGPLKSGQVTFLDGAWAEAFTSYALDRGETGVHLLSRHVETVRDFSRLAGIDGNPFVALNTALWQEGVYVRLPAGTEVEVPIHLLFLSSRRGEPFLTHPRVFVEAGEGSRATIVESHLGAHGGRYFTNAVTEVHVGAGAQIDYIKVQRESPDAFHVASLQARVARDGIFRSHSISLGALLSRNDVGCMLDGEGAECVLNGLYEVTGGQTADSHTTIEHRKPRTTSRELYKGILDGRGRGVFDGRILVRSEAGKTDAMQTNKNLLLSAEAMVHTKPQLEILANDVKCRHGATIGQLDRDVLFYLRSRGIGIEEARRLLVHAFASEIVDQVRIDAVRSQLGGCLRILAPGAP